MSIFSSGLLTTTTEGGTNTGMIIAMIAIVVVVIGLFVWQTISGRKKQKAAQDMVQSLKIGDKVKTIGGICGFVAEINDEENTIVLETGLGDNKSYIKFDKGAIYQTGSAATTEAATPVEDNTQKAVEDTEKESKVDGEEIDKK